MKLQGEVYQFLSRANIHNVRLGRLGTRNTSPKQRPDISMSIEYEICDKPFEINFAQVIPSRPSIGAHEYIDPNVDIYMKQRWPKCIKGIAQIQVTEKDLQDLETIKRILEFLQLNIWTLKDHFTVLQEYTDNFATVTGFRRKYFDSQIFDISGNRRPHSSENYIATSVSEYVGPGVSIIQDIFPFENVNELVWSQIIPFPNQSVSDLPSIRKKALEIKKHYNSYNELQDARRHLSCNEIKACVRSAASAIDAILHYYCDSWNVRFPDNERITFDEKIEKVLATANKPSYKTADSDKLQGLLYLYRARNSMHTGDCNYKDRLGNEITVRTQKQAAEFVEAAEAFTIWIDSLV